MIDSHLGSESRLDWSGLLRYSHREALSLGNNMIQFFNFVSPTTFRWPTSFCFRMIIWLSRSRFPHSISLWQRGVRRCEVLNTLYFWAFSLPVKRILFTVTRILFTCHHEHEFSLPVTRILFTVTRILFTHHQSIEFSWPVTRILLTVTRILFTLYQ